MAEFKLNEEQRKLMRKFSDDVDKLIERYSNMEKAFQASTNIVGAQKNSSKSERIEDIQKKIEKLQFQITLVREKLGKINYLANGYDGYKSAASLLLALQSFIGDAKYELGKLEGYSSGDIYTFEDTCVFARNYEALKKSLLKE